MASKRRVRRRECEGKVRHGSKEGAMTAIRKGGQAFAGCHAYYCTICGSWHAGHPKRYRASTTPAKHRWDRASL